MLTHEGVLAVTPTAEVVRFIAAAYEVVLGANDFLTLGDDSIS